MDATGLMGSFRNLILSRCISIDSVSGGIDLHRFRPSSIILVVVGVGGSSCFSSGGSICFFFFWGNDDDDDDK